MPDEAQTLLVSGIASVKAKEYAEARHYLEWMLRIDADPEQCMEAWYWLSEISTDTDEKHLWLEKMLASNPGEPRARRNLAVLQGRLNSDEIVDPDQLNKPAPSLPHKTGAERFICPECGGRMTYTPDGSSLICEFCESRQRLASHEKQNSPEEQDFLVAMATSKGHLNPSAYRTFDCQGCGANFLLAPDHLTLTCPYCRSVYVIQNQQTRQLIDPAGLIPLRITEPVALQALKDWLDHHHPKFPIRVDHGVAIYLPVWCFTMGGEIGWNCQRHNGSAWVHDQGTEIVLIPNLLVPASKRLSKDCLAELNHYDLEGLVAYDPGYLADWPAETYQVEVGDASLDARQMALEIERRSIQDKFTFQRVNNLVLDSSSMLVDSFKLILLPIWITHINMNDVHFEVVINGQKGTVSGEWSKT